MQMTPETEIPPCLSVVMPVYNEAATLPTIVARVLSLSVVAELVIVDDCSADNTWTTLQALAKENGRIRLFRHSINQGKGAAIRTGFKKVTADIVLIQDADLEYDPLEYPRLLAPILDGRADVVYGSRFLGSEAHRVLYYWHSVGNRCLTTLSNMFTNLNLTDMETCFKVFKQDVVRSMEIEENRFGFEPEITAKLARVRPALRIYEVAISYNGRTYEEGKKIGWKDGFRALWCIIKYGVKPFAYWMRIPDKPVREDFEFTALQEASNYRRTIIGEFSGELRGKVAEIGAGIGQITEEISKLPSVRSLSAVEPDPRFHTFHTGKPWTLIPSTSAALNHDEQWDCIILINVLEHIEEDEKELSTLYTHLKASAGSICLLVPACPELYSNLDQDFGHHRRYTRPELIRKLQAAGFQVTRCDYFNSLGYLAWGLAMTILRKRTFSKTGVRIYDRYFFPWVHWIESKVCRPFIGQSLIAVGKAV